MRRIKHTRESYLPDIPRWIERLLEASDTYRAWLRRRKNSISEDPTNSDITEWPQWITEGHYKGFDNYYTAMNGRYFNISLEVRHNTIPAYSVDISEYKIDNTNQYGLLPQVPGQPQSVYIHWVELEAFKFTQLKDAEAKRQEIMDNFEVIVMMYTL